SGADVSRPPPRSAPVWERRRVRRARRLLSTSAAVGVGMVERVERAVRVDGDPKCLVRPRVLDRDVDLAAACAPEELHVEAVAAAVIQLTKLGMPGVRVHRDPPRSSPLPRVLPSLPRSSVTDTAVCRRPMVRETGGFVS